MGSCTAESGLGSSCSFFSCNLKVHVVYREVTVADSPITTHEDSDFSDSDDYDLSDTDNEDEWQTLPQAV